MATRERQNESATSGSADNIRKDLVIRGMQLLDSLFGIQGADFEFG